MLFSIAFHWWPLSDFTSARIGWVYYDPSSVYGKSFIKLSGVLYRILLRNILTASSWGNHRPCWNLKHVRTEKINRGVAINGVVGRARRRESLSETLLSVRSNAKKKTFRCRTCQKDPYLGQKCLCWIQEGKFDIKSALSVAEFTLVLKLSSVISYQSVF